MSFVTIELKRGDSVTWVRKSRDGERIEVPAKVVHQTPKRVTIELDVGMGPMIRVVQRKDLQCMGPRRQ